jgi:hypothetical protein
MGEHRRAAQTIPQLTAGTTAVVNRHFLAPSLCREGVP